MNNLSFGDILYRVDISALDITSYRYINSHNLLDIKSNQIEKWNQRRYNGFYSNLHDAKKDLNRRIKAQLKYMQEQLKENEE